MNRRRMLAFTGAAIVSLPGCLGDTEYVVNDVSAGSVSGPLSIDVEVLEAKAGIDEPAQLGLTLANESDRPVRVRNAGIWPLGVLTMGRSTPNTQQTETPTSSQATGADQGGRVIDVSGTERQIPLWNDAYQNSENVDIEGNDSVGVSSTPLTRSLQGGKRETETYEIRGRDLTQGGTFYLRGYFNPEHRSDDTPPLCLYAPVGIDSWREFLPTVTIDISAQKPIPGL